VKVAVAQIACSLGDVAANLRKISEFTARAAAAHAELVVFPEMVDTGYAMPVIREHASSWSEGAVPQLQDVARQHSLGIICGVSERADGGIYNSQVFIDSTGAIVGKYRKAHLFTSAPIEEHTCFTCGNELGSFSFANLQLALSICYDLRFPELYRALAIEQQANVFVISSAWPFPRTEHLRVLATARAIENQCYCILSNRVGTDAGTAFCGGSTIIDPYGGIIAAASADREELLLGDISAEVVQSVRTRMQVLDHRRPEIYR
jgi:omega-amidase